MKKKKTLKIVLIVIGIILIFSSLRSVYYAYKHDKDYELRGYKTVAATCLQEESYIKSVSR